MSDIHLTCRTCTFIIKKGSTSQSRLLHLAFSVASMVWFRSPLLRSPWLHSPIFSLAKRDPIFVYRCSHNVAMSCPSLPHDPDSPWDPNYPIANNHTPSAISRDEVLFMLRQGQTPGKDFLLVDLRQADHTVRNATLRVIDEQLLIGYLTGRNYSRVDQFASTELVSQSSYSLYTVCKCEY